MENRTEQNRKLTISGHDFQGLEEGASQIARKSRDSRQVQIILLVCLLLFDLKFCGNTTHNSSISRRRLCGTFRWTSPSRAQIHLAVSQRDFDFPSNVQNFWNTLLPKRPFSQHNSPTQLKSTQHAHTHAHTHTYTHTHAHSHRAADSCERVWPRCLWPRCRAWLWSHPSAVCGGQVNDSVSLHVNVTCGPLVC